MRIVEYVANQLDIDSRDFYKYINTKNTKYEHLDSICSLFKYSKYNKNTETLLVDELLQIAQEDNNSFNLVSNALNILRKYRVINPSIRTIEQIVWQVKQEVEGLIFNLVD